MFRSCLAIYLLASVATAEEIPLKSIHALNAPYASDIRELEPKHLETTVKGSKVSRILEAIQKMKSAGPALVVSGEALPAVHDVIVDGKEQGPLPTKGLTLVFYALPCSPYVVLDSVDVVKNKITVKYHFVTSAVAKMNRTLAFIPLPELVKGRAEVEIVQLPMKKGRFASPKPMPEEAVDRIICKPLKFQME